MLDKSECPALKKPLIEGLFFAPYLKNLGLVIMPWQPGQSGNPTGIVKEKTFRAALDRAIAQDNGKRLRQTMEKLLR
jgi:hypothetical protein